MHFSTILFLLSAAATAVVAAPAAIPPPDIIGQPRCKTTCSDGFYFTESCLIRYIQDPCKGRKHGHTLKTEKVPTRPKIEDPIPEPIPEFERQCKTTCKDGTSIINPCNMQSFQDVCVDNGGSTGFEELPPITPPKANDTKLEVFTPPKVEDPVEEFTLPIEDPVIGEGPQCKTTCGDGTTFIDSCYTEYFVDVCHQNGGSVGQREELPPTETKEPTYTSAEPPKAEPTVIID